MYYIFGKSEWPHWILQYGEEGLESLNRLFSLTKLEIRFQMILCAPQNYDMSIPLGIMFFMILVCN